jgi:2-polyprenyl-3-methyl-5-hydroxy-6-metoxy-1,4-benzoquinol methylase
LTTRFPTAPRWYRPVLLAEDALLYCLRGRLPTQAHLHGEDRATANFVSNARLGIAAAERMVPGANASPYMVQHVGRYVWAMNACRGLVVVDLGCGDGYGTSLLSWVCRSAVGIDISADAVEAARARYPGVEYRVADLADPAAIPAADMGVCFEVLEHIASAEQVLAVAAERIPRLLLSVPNPLAGGSHINPHHVNDWPLSRLKKSLRAAGARSIRGHHQRLRGHHVSRGALPWQPFWLLDVRFR